MPIQNNSHNPDLIGDIARSSLIQPWPTAGAMGAETRAYIGAGDGIYVYDETGKALMDGPAGMWCVNAGHRNVELARVMQEQALQLGYASPWYSVADPAARLAGEIAKRTPGDLNHSFFTTGGSAAVDTALRLMQFYNNVRGKPNKKLIVSRGAAYHGSTYLTGSLNGKPRDRDWMDQANDLVIKLSAPDPFRRPKGMSLEAFTDHLVDEFKSVIAAYGPERIGAFVAEPIQASGGVIVPPPGYLQRMRALTREHDILYISDEVVTAFGRLGSIFASQEIFGIEPDMITFAKGITSGYFPLGGLAIADRILDEIRQSGKDDAMFANGYTYSSHPIGCAVALKNLELLEAGLLQNVREVAPYFQEQLASLADLPLVGEVRGLGLMACVECVADRESNNPLALDVSVGQRIDAHCQQLGLMVRPIIHMCVMSPPLMISRAQVDEMVSILRQGITRTMDDLVREGLWRG